MQYEKIKKIEDQIFQPKVVGSIPNSFFEYTADVIVNADYYNEIAIPKDFEQFIISAGGSLSSEFVSLIKSENITEQDSNFTQAYIDLFMYKYRYFFKTKSKYLLRGIQTPTEYGTWSKAGLNNANEEHYVAFDIDNLIPKESDGFIDFDKLKENEENESRIPTYSSVSGSLPIAHYLMFDQFNAITKKGFLTMERVYGQEVLLLCKHLTRDLLFYFSKIIYQNIRQGILISDTVDNTIAYYAQMIFPPNHKFPSDMMQLEITLSEYIKRFIKEVLTSLNKESAEEVYLEFIETILLMIMNGDFIPLYFYKTEFREGSLFDVEDYNAHIVADLYAYEADNSLARKPIESYGFIVDDDNMMVIIEESFQNKFLFQRFINLFNNG